MSDAHKEAIKRGMLRASAEGRLHRPKAHVMVAMQQAATRPDVVERRKWIAAATMRGRPQAADKLSAAAEHNARSKIFEICSPDKQWYKVKNLNHFVRTHPELFSPDDVVWKENQGNLWCRASLGLRALFRKGKYLRHQWKGWTGRGDPVKPE